MADLDIMPYKASGGQACRVVDAPLDGSASFLRGEPVIIDAGGAVNESGNDPDFGTEGSALFGIAAVSAQGIADSRGDGTIANSALEPVQVYMIDLDVEFITRNLFDSGATATYTAANIGDECNLELVSGSWGIDTTPTHANFIITGLLDADGKDAVLNSSTIVAARFKRMHLVAT